MLNELIEGLKSYTGAYSLISKLKLWNYFWIPVIISALVACLIFASAYGFSDNLGLFIAKAWPWEWASETINTVSEWLSGFIILVVGIILYKHIVLALAAPFMGVVSEKIEAHLLGETNHIHKHSSSINLLFRGIRINLRNLMMELLLSVPFTILSFIPGVNLFTTAILFLIQSYYAGFGNMDYTLERHLSYRKSIAFVRQHRGLAIGNGMIFMFLLVIPILGVIIVLPLSAVAATTITLRQLDKQETTLKTI
ncbi:MAG: coproporphyrinogen III oxidase [Bacteroidetes bacterium MedPE-SWsnd-G2]|nr:MAG: coproporphyrinogen III oxidase [Bacteroidetes bacterium MedPE-SWsnd-G2]